jgi:hypothetical protein
MADKLDWLNRHLVAVRYTSVADAVAGEGYKIPPDAAAFFKGVSNAEDAVFKLASAGRFKDACEFLPYIAHRRAGVWWGYRCVLSLLEELAVNPPEERDIADIGADMEPVVPDFAKIELPPPNPEVKAAVDSVIAESQAAVKAANAKLDQEMLSYLQDAVETAFQEFKRIHKIHPIDLLKQIGAKLAEPRNQIDPNSPVLLEATKLKAEIAAMRAQTVDTIKSVLPPKVPEHEKKLRDGALAAVYRWVNAPDAENSQKCLDAGNECPDTPAGLLSLSAFWAFGNLMPLGEQVVPTPPSLAANGLCQTLLLCALQQGGVRKVKERYEEYFRLGVEVFTGADNWGDTLASGHAPHESPFSAPPSVTPHSAPPPPAPEAPPARNEEGSAEDGGAPSEPVQNPPPAAPPVYRRWRPG